MSPKTAKNGRSVRALRNLRAEIDDLQAKLTRLKAEFEVTEEFEVGEARELLDLLLGRVQREGERLYLCRGGKRVAALVPADEAEFLTEWEDRHDIEAARKAVNEPSIPWEEVKKELGL